MSVELLNCIQKTSVQTKIKLEGCQYNYSMKCSYGGDCYDDWDSSYYEDSHCECGYDYDDCNDCECDCDCDCWDCNCDDYDDDFSDGYTEVDFGCREEYLEWLEDHDCE